MSATESTPAAPPVADDLLAQLAALPGEAVEITIWHEPTEDEPPWLCHVNAGVTGFGEGGGDTLQEAVEQALGDYKEADSNG